MRKLILYVVFVIIAGVWPCMAAPAAAQSLPPDTAAALAQEPPLNQADIDAFILYGPTLIRASRTNDVDAGAAALASAGWSVIRSSYVVSKISNGYAISVQPQMARAMLESASMPDVLIPTATEQELIKQNMSALDAVFGALTPSRP